MSNPDMSGALMGEEIGGDLEPGLFDEPDAGLELGAGDESELDELFAADAQAVFPDFDDEQLLSLQKLIDSRIAAGAPTVDAGAPEGDLGL